MEKFQKIFDFMISILVLAPLIFNSIVKSIEIIHLNLFIDSFKLTLVYITLISNIILSLYIFIMLIIIYSIDSIEKVNKLNFVKDVVLVLFGLSSLIVTKIIFYKEELFLIDLTSFYLSGILIIVSPIVIYFLKKIIRLF